MSYLQDIGIVRSLAQLKPESLEDMVDRLMTGLLHKYFKTEEAFCVCPQKRIEHKPDFIVIKIRAENYVEEDCLIVEDKKPRERLSHDDIATDQLLEQLACARNSSGRLYGAVCKGKNIKFYTFDQWAPHPTGGEGRLKSLILWNRNNTYEISGVLNLETQAEDVEDVFNYIKNHPIRD